MVRREELIKKYPLPWTQDKITHFRQTLLAWYDKHGRDLPWRQTKNPYYIWVSEIMLQQTQVDTVKPYYLRFIQKLPQIKDLAQASEETIMNLWQGLGYYSRVRNMQVAAQTIMNEFGGEMPSTFEALLSLKGIGPYTAGAISSIAFEEVQPAMDGNLIRIVTRLFEIKEDVSLTRTQHKIRAYLYQLIDPKRPGDFNQALMDIGATIMTATNHRPNPHPLKEFDQSYINHTSHLYPIKKAKPKASHHKILAYHIQDSVGKILFRRHDSSELLTGLWHFPLVEQDIVLEGLSQDELIFPLIQSFGDDLKYLIDDLEQIRVTRAFGRIIQSPATEIQVVKHVFSHRVWHCQVIPLEIPKNQSTDVIDGYRWIAKSELENLPISTLQKKLWQQYYGDD